MEQHRRRPAIETEAAWAALLQIFSARYRRPMVCPGSCNVCCAFRCDLAPAAVLPTAPEEDSEGTQLAEGGNGGATNDKGHWSPG